MNQATNTTSRSNKEAGWKKALVVNKREEFDTEDIKAGLESMFKNAQKP